MSAGRQHTAELILKHRYLVFHKIINNYVYILITKIKVSKNQKIAISFVSIKEHAPPRLMLLNVSLIFRKFLLQSAVYLPDGFHPKSVH